MHAFRLLLAHRRSATLLVVLTLALRLLVPGGYMVSAGADGIAITLCPGTTAAAPAPAMPMAGMSHATTAAGHSKGGTEEHGRADMPCAFSGLMAPVLGGADAVLLVAALAFVALLMLFAAHPRPSRAIPHLRPPLRGPPLLR